MDKLAALPSAQRSDLFREASAILGMSPAVVKERAINDLWLLADVVRFKMRFYRSAWARYEEAKPGTFKLVPKQEHLVSLSKDYGKMKVMIFGEIPEFDRIIESLSILEKEINGLT